METLGAILLDGETLLDFPCRYPLKVVGKNCEEFQETVRSIIRKYMPEDSGVSYSTRASGGGKYLSITAIFVARGQEQLKAIYSELGGCNLVLVTL